MGEALLRAEVASLALVLAEELERALDRSRTAERSLDRVHALAEASACCGLIRALRERHSWLDLRALSNAEADIAQLEAEYLQRGHYAAARRTPTDPVDPPALARWLAPLLERGRTATPKPPRPLHHPRRGLTQRSSTCRS